MLCVKVVSVKLSVRVGSTKLVTSVVHVLVVVRIATIVRSATCVLIVITVSVAQTQGVLTIATDVHYAGIVKTQSY